MSGLLVLAAHRPGPLDLYEVGASGGLNMLLDRYGYDLGGLSAGDPTSPVRLAPKWEGPPPPAAPVGIVRRRGVDLEPIDPVRDGERLLAYVWPEQHSRLAQLEAALAVAAADPPVVERGEAADWLDARLAEPPLPGAIRTIFHSIAFQYFPEASRRRIETRLAEAGAIEPLAWLRYEKEPGEERITLRLRIWPGGEDRLLASGHPHGRAIRWFG
jgi:hypothetical protein